MRVGGCPNTKGARFVRPFFDSVHSSEVVEYRSRMARFGRDSSPPDYQFVCASTSPDSQFCGEMSRL